MATRKCCQTNEVELHAPGCKHFVDRGESIVDAPAYMGNGGRSNGPDAPFGYRFVQTGDAKVRFHTIHNLERALETYRKRNKVYGSNYKRFGAIMTSLYPDGITLKSVEDFNRFGVLIQMISKLSRYVTDPKQGHLDSIHDMGVYSFMMEELDAEAVGLDVTPPEPLVTTVKAADVLPNPCQHVYRWPCEYPGWRGHVCSLLTPHICAGSPSCIQCGETKEKPNPCQHVYGNACEMHSKDYGCIVMVTNRDKAASETKTAHTQDCAKLCVRCGEECPNQ